jgi:hypothetical protein
MIQKIVLVLAIIAFTFTAKAQQDEVEYSNPNITTSDIKAVLETLEMGVYKFGVSLPENTKYYITLYIDEYNTKGKIKSDMIWRTGSPYRKVNNGDISYKAFDGVRIISKSNKSDFVLNMGMGDFGIKNYKIKIDSLYTNPHAIMPFHINEMVLKEGNTPLILIGSFWESKLPVGKKLPEDATPLLRFCFEKELNPDMSNEAFKNMPHYFIIGIEVKKQ